MSKASQLEVAELDLNRLKLEPADRRHLSSFPSTHTKQVAVNGPLCSLRSMEEPSGGSRDSKHVAVPPPHPMWLPNLTQVH